MRGSLEAIFGATGGNNPHNPMLGGPMPFKNRKVKVPAEGGKEEGGGESGGRTRGSDDGSAGSPGRGGAGTMFTYGALQAMNKAASESGGGGGKLVHAKKVKMSGRGKRRGRGGAAKGFQSL